MKNSILPYNPGEIPTKPCPKAGEVLKICVKGLPPYKDLNQSIRNRKHRAHDRFIKLREAAYKAMAGRAWYFGPVEVYLDLYGDYEEFDKKPHEYLSGIVDTLDGSSGRTFTYLPIIFEDDNQVKSGGYEIFASENIYYNVHIKFCENT